MKVTVDQITDHMRGKSTDDLLALWQDNSRDQWTSDAFVAAERVLAERGVIIPIQPQEDQSSVIRPLYKGVRGWLLLLCINLTILSPLVIFAAHGALGEDIFQPTFGMVFDLILAACYVYVGVCLWRVRPHAVRNTKWLLSISAILNALTFLETLSQKNAVVASGAIRGIAGSLVWLLYLSASKRVAATYS